MPMVGAAATADLRQLWQQVPDSPVLATRFVRVAVVAIGSGSIAAWLIF
jgi:hypothetical protein